jgi:site-specific DNA recombinase
MKTAIYSRKSTNKQGQKDTIENQIKICRRKAEELGLEIVAIKTDAATGTDDNNRPEVKELIRDAVQGKYQCVIMKGISRLYRSTSKGLELIEKLDQHGIRVITVEEHFDSASSENRTGNQLDTSRMTMYLMFAEMESKKLASRIKYTQIEKAHAGEWNQPSSVPFGYLYNSDTKKLEIDDIKAPIVELIFNLYVKGTGMKSIAFYLNGDNPEGEVFPSPKGKRWSEYTIGFILKNRVYLGEVVYNKRSRRKRPYKQPQLIGKTEDDLYIGNDYNQKEEWIITKNAHDAIINEEIFNQAQDIIGTKSVRKGIRNNVSLLAGIGKCGLCGSGLTFKRGRKNSLGQVVTKDNYYCMNYIRYGKQFCTSHHMGAVELEGKVIKTLKIEFEKRINKQKALNSSVGNKKLSTGERDIKKTESNIAAIHHKMKILFEKNMEGKVSDLQYSALNEMYELELKSLTDTLAKMKIKSMDNKKKESGIEKLERHYDTVMNIEKLPIEEQRYRLIEFVPEVVLANGKIKVKLDLEE